MTTFLWIALGLSCVANLTQRVYISYLQNQLKKG